MIIDVHNHAIPPSVIDLFRKESGYGVSFPDSLMRLSDGFQFPLNPSFYDGKAKLAELAAHELDGAVLSVAPPTFLYGIDAALGEELCETSNEGLAKFAEVAPERLRWIGHIPMQNPDAATAMLKRLKSQGAVGVEVGTHVNGVRLDDKAFEPFWAAAAADRLLVMLHPYNNAAYPGLADWYLQNAIGNPLETMIASCRLICAGILDRFPGAEILLVHGGGHLPYQLGRLRHAISVRPELKGVTPDPWTYAREMKFDTLTHDADALKYLVSRVGAGNVFVGTDLPFDMAPSKPMATLRAAVTPSEVETIAKTNPARLFALELVQPEATAH
jgi:aminocarboxymuconate-semialdehyde decarboxylase